MIVKFARDVVDAGALLIGAVLEWFDDLEPSERVARALFVVIVLGCAVVIDPATVSGAVEVSTVVPSGVVVRG